MKSLKALKSKPITLAILIILVITLPILVWGLITGNFELRERASTGEPTAPPSPSPTPPVAAKQTLVFRLKLEGVVGGDAEGAKIQLRFLNQSGSINKTFAPIGLTHVGNAEYEGTLTIEDDFLPSDTYDYAIFVKGEKHIARKFCRQNGQTSACTGTGEINVPNPLSGSTYTYNFVGLALEPGDLYQQDGKADSNDFSKIKSLMSKTCESLSNLDKLTGDLDYNGCINIKDAFLMRKTLEVKYDEN